MLRPKLALFALKTTKKTSKLEDLTRGGGRGSAIRHRKRQLHVKKMSLAAVSHLGFLMSGLVVPGSEQPRLERGRSSIGTDGPGGG